MSSSSVQVTSNMAGPAAEIGDRPRRGRRLEGSQQRSVKRLVVELVEEVVCIRPGDPVIAVACWLVDWSSVAEPITCGQAVTARTACSNCTISASTLWERDRLTPGGG